MPSIRPGINKSDITWDSFGLTMALVSLHVSDNLEQLEIVNQLLLPHVTEFIPVNNIQDAHKAIRSMKVFVDLKSLSEFT